MFEHTAQGVHHRFILGSTICAISPLTESFFNSDVIRQSHLAVCIFLLIYNNLT